MSEVWKSGISYVPVTTCFRIYTQIFGLCALRSRYVFEVDRWLSLKTWTICLPPTIETYQLQTVPTGITPFYGDAGMTCVTRLLVTLSPNPVIRQKRQATRSLQCDCVYHSPLNMLFVVATSETRVVWPCMAKMTRILHFVTFWNSFVKVLRFVQYLDEFLPIAYR